jgi:hypothetical protein
VNVGDFRASGVCVTTHHAMMSSTILHAYINLHTLVNNLKLGTQ